MNQFNNTLSDLELDTVVGGGASSKVPNTTNAPMGGSGPAGSKNPTLGTSATGVNVLLAVWGFILGKV